MAAAGTDALDVILCDVFGRGGLLSLSESVLSLWLWNDILILGCV